MQQELPIFTVSELNNRIKTLIDSDPALSSLYVTGELSNYKTYPSGHHYFSMKDDKATIRCVMFRSSAQNLPFKPENGMKVVALGRISVFERDGQYQLYCTQIIPEGVGALYVAYEQLKEKLSKEGLFDPKYKKPLPPYPERIALVTSSAGAALQDMQRVLKARWPVAEVVIVPTRVQGAEAPAEICQALSYADMRCGADIIITGRGGGSIEDLWAFNDEQVAYTIFRCRTPVISGVGHEPDFTISDFVADVRAATPSNAAELAVPDIVEVKRSIHMAQAKTTRSLVQLLVQSRQRLNNYAEKRVLQDPINYIQDKRLALDYSLRNLIAIAEKVTAEKREGYIRLISKLDALSPLKVLSRGFAIVSREDGTVIKSAAQTKIGEKVDIRLNKGGISCTIQRIKKS